MPIFTGLITCKNKKECEKIALILLQKKLIACASIIENINSMYWWKGKIEKEQECLLLIKTGKNFSKKIIFEIEKIHSYEIPAIEFIKVENSGKKFQKWIKEVLKKQKTLI